MNLHQQFNSFFLLLFALIGNSIKSQKPFLTFPAEHKVKVTFGSCNKFYETDNSTIFNTITSYKTDLFIWLGKQVDITLFMDLRGCCLC